MMTDYLLRRIVNSHKAYQKWIALVLCLSILVSIGTFAALLQIGEAKTYPEEVLESREVSVSMPEQHFEKIAGGVKVLAEAPEGAFPENTVMSLTPVNGNFLRSEIADAIESDILEIQAVDIKFLSPAGEIIEPRNPIRVTLTPVVSSYQGESGQVVHVIKEGEDYVVETAEGVGPLLERDVAFDAESFSIYAVVYSKLTKTIRTASGESYEVTVTYGEEAGIPKGAELKVREITEEDEEYAIVQSKAEEQLVGKFENGIPAHPILLDIGLYDGEKEVEPANDSVVSVEIKLMKSSLAGQYSDTASSLLINDQPVDEDLLSQSLQIVHAVDEDRMEIVDVREIKHTEQIIGQFQTSSFSNWLVFLDEKIDEIRIGQGDSITLRPYSEWIWDQQNTVDGTAVSWVRPVTNGIMNCEAKTYTDNELQQTYTFYHLTTNSNTGNFYLEKTNGEKIHVIVDGGGPSGRPDTVTGIDDIKVNLFNYDLDHSLDEERNVASFLDPVNGQYTTQEWGAFGQRVIYYQPGPYINDGVNAASALKFLGWGANNGGNRINNYTATSVTTGIVQSSISEADPYPRLNGNGDTSLSYLFSAGNPDVEAHLDVPGLFQKDESTGYYYFNSNTNYARFNGERVELYSHTYTQNTGNSGVNSKPIGFFPFHAYDSDNDLSPNHNKNLDHHFGLSMTVKFTLPEGKVMTGDDGTVEPIRFLFSGDDDMWVFIDDDLTLDMGGIHQPISGEINFTNDSRFQAGKEYTMRIFYLERGGCDSNCSIRFNMPLSLGTGDIRLVKAKNRNPGDTDTTYLGGAVFGIWENENCSGDPIRTVTSDPETGLVRIENLPVREAGQVYYLREITPPEGFRENETIYTVTASREAVNGKFSFTIQEKDNPDSILEQLSQEPDENASVIFNSPINESVLTVEKQWQDQETEHNPVEIAVYGSTQEHPLRRITVIFRATDGTIIDSITGMAEQDLNASVRWKNVSGKQPFYQIDVDDPNGEGTVIPSMDNKNCRINFQHYDKDLIVTLTGDYEIKELKLISIDSKTVRFPAAGYYQLDGVHSWILTGTERETTPDLSKLPLTGDAGHVYIYHVVEKPIEGYKTTYLPDGTQQGTLTIVNEKEDETPVSVDICLLKVDGENKEKALDGAKFALYRKDEGGNYAIVTSIPDVSLDSHHWFTVPEAGITLKGLGAGEYKITEEAAPNGYVVTDKTPVVFEIGTDGTVTNQSIERVEYLPENKQFVVPNSAGTVLPNTGGVGATACTAFGALLTGFAGILLGMTKKMSGFRKRETELKQPE